MTHQHRGAQAPWARNDVFGLGLVLVFAMLLRVAFFTGFFGADEVVYLQMARGIWQGDWLPSEYIGALRYGVNIPMAMFMKMFGPSEFVAGLWGLVTSVGEVALVFVAARQFWGLRAALFASLCLAALPLHAHLAGRLMADSPLAFFVTASFLTTWMAERRNSIGPYLLAGLAIGSLYWIKDAVFFITVLMLGLYILVTWRWHARWFWMAAAALAMILANALLFWKVQGDPLHLFMILQRGLSNPPSMPQSSMLYYFNYLLIDLKHFWLLFYLALGGIVTIVFRKLWFGAFKRPEAYVLFWALGFLGILSLLALRQTNYMLIFAAPLALLSGYFLISIPRIWQSPLIALVLAGGVVLSAFEQQAVQTFTANSRATVAFANEHPNEMVFAGQGARRAYAYQDLLGKIAPETLPIVSWSDVGNTLSDRRAVQTQTQTPVYASATAAYLIKDPQMDRWGDQMDAQWSTQFAQTCLVQKPRLEPASMGWGRYVVDAVMAASVMLPGKVGGRLNGMLQNTLKPPPAKVFAIVAPCFKPR